MINGITGERRRHAVKLMFMIVVSTGFFGVEIAFGHITKSVALVGDSYNMLSNIMSMLLSLACIWLATRDSKKNTFGWARAEITGALINSVFLVAMCFSICVTSVQRLFYLEAIEHPRTLVIVGSVGLAVNLLGVAVFFGELFGSACSRKNGDPSRRASQCSTGENIPADQRRCSWGSGSQMNIQGVFLHILGDALGSVVVVASALVVMLCEGDWKYNVDPALSLVMALIIACSTISLIKQTSRILLQHLPCHMTASDMLEDMYHKVNGLKGVHDFHVWQLAGSHLIASLHLKSTGLVDYTVVSRRLRRFFHGYGIGSLTIQPEFFEEAELVDVDLDDTERDNEEQPNRSDHGLESSSTPIDSPLEAETYGVGGGIFHVFCSTDVLVFDPVETINGLVRF